MSISKRITTICGTLLLLPSLVMANTSSEQVVSKVISAYGGDNLTALSSIRITDSYKGFRYGQSYSPTDVDKVDYRSIVNWDIKTGAKSFQWVRGNIDGYSTQHRIFDGDTGYAVNHYTNTYAQTPSINARNVDRNLTYMLDTALAIMLNQASESIKMESVERVNGAPHQRLTFTPEGHPTLTLFVHLDSGRISKMQRPHWRPNEVYSYFYTSFKEQDGIHFAENTYVTRGGQPYSVGSGRKLELNPSLQTAFAPPAYYSVGEPGLDLSEMSVSQIAPNLYIAGSDWGFSMFYDTGDFYIGAGSYEDLSERLNAVQTFAKNKKALRYQVASHHHLDHLGGMDEAYNLGATIIAAPAHFDTIRGLIETEVADGRLVSPKDIDASVLDYIQIIDMPSGHADHNLATYFKQAQVLFTADTYFSRMQQGAPSGYEGLKRIADKLAQLKVEPAFFAAAHSNRVLTAQDFQYSLQNLRQTRCPQGWTICPE